jgi:hypothetical protein
LKTSEDFPLEKGMEMKNRTLFWGAIFSVLISFFSCGLQENMEDMRNTTKDVAKTSKDLGKQTGDMAKQTAMLHRQQRQAVANQNRESAYKGLKDKGSSFPEKMVQAAKYFQAFEFQIWENILQDDEAARLDLLAVAAQEFVGSVKGIIALEGSKLTGSDTRLVDPNPVTPNSEMQSLLALAYSMPEINLLQLQASIKPGSSFVPTSIYELVVNSLLLKDLVNETAACISVEGTKRMISTHPDVPNYACEILVFEEVAVYMLQLRLNILTAFTVSMAGDLDYKNIFGRLEPLLKRKWTLDFSQKNVAQVNYLTSHLGMAREAIGYLNELDESKRLDGKIRKFIKRMRIKYSKDIPSGLEGAIEGFKAEYDAYIEEI